MSEITGAELNLLRTRPQLTRLWLSIYKPTTIFACQVDDGGIERNEREITYNNVTTGAFGDIESGMTMFIGTAPGLSDVGRIRVREADGSVITVAENSDIDWEDDRYLTVINFFEIWPVYPRIILNPGSDPATVTFYKDYDIAYANQNSALGSILEMGPHHAAFLEDGSVDVYYTATGTVSLDDDALAFQWEFEGGLPTGSTSMVPGNITYDTPGHYTTRLTVISDSQVEDESFRHVSIYDRPGEGTNLPILKWEMEGLQGSRSQGGYTTRITIHQDVDDIVDGSLVVIFTDNWYGSTEQSIGGNAENRSSIFFVGYIIEGSVEYDYKQSLVNFQVGSPSQIMKMAEGFSVSVEDSANPATWFQLLNLDVQRSIFHYLRWHSTVLKTTDFEFTTTDYPIQYFDADRGSIYDAINTLISGTLVGSVVCDRQGKIWAEQEVSSQGIATGTYPIIQEIDNQDWIGEPSIDEKQSDVLSYLEMGGIAYSGQATGTFSALLCEAPGNAPGYRGSIQRRQGLALLDQTQLNVLVGHYFANMNAAYPNIALNIAGNYDQMDIAPQEFYLLNISADENVRGIEFLETPCVARSIAWTYKSESGLLLPSTNLWKVENGLAAQTVEFLDVPPTAGDGGGGFAVQPLNLPPIPPIAFPSFVFDFGLGGSDLGKSMMVGHSFENGPGFTAQTSWTAMPVGTGIIGWDAEGVDFSGTSLTVDNDTIYWVALKIKFNADPGEVWAAVVVAGASENYPNIMFTMDAGNLTGSIYWAGGSGLYPLATETTYNVMLKVAVSQTAYAEISVVGAITPPKTGVNLSFS